MCRISVRRGIFQSTPPRRRRPIQGYLIHMTLIISIHASAKEATAATRTVEQQTVFQSTPPRRRRHYAAEAKAIKEEISIHASAKEATGYQYMHT